jgi:hypothetical protein
MLPVGYDQFLVRVQDRERLRPADKRGWAEGSLLPRASSFDNSPGLARCEERQVEPIGLVWVALCTSPLGKGI